MFYGIILYGLWRWELKYWCETSVLTVSDILCNCVSVCISLVWSSWPATSVWLSASLVVLSHSMWATAYSVQSSSKLTPSGQTCLCFYGEACSLVSKSQQVAKFAYVMLLPRFDLTPELDYRILTPQPCSHDVGFGWGWILNLMSWVT